MVKIIGCFLAFLFCALFFSTALAWNAKGHVLISQMAYDHLTFRTKERVDHLALLVWNRLPVRTKHHLNRYYKDSSTFAKISVLPDQWRHQTLQTIFYHFHAPLPQSLKAEQSQTTKHWHYADQPYPNISCPIRQSNNVIWAVNQTAQAFRYDTNNKAKAVLLVMLEHWVEDAHQPLHLISFVSRHCRSDFGGNLFCVSKKKHHHCRTLHALWDNGVGFLSGRKNINIAAKRLEMQYSYRSFSPEIIHSKPQQWAKAAYQYAPFIYDTKKFQKPKPVYYTKGTLIAQKQMALAAYRLAHLLNNLIEKGE